MKSTKKEKKQYKKAFQEAMARELREHKSSFIVFSILRILVLVVLAYIAGRLFPDIPVTVIGAFNEVVAGSGIVQEDGSFDVLALFGNNLRAMVLSVLYGFIPFIYLPALSLGVNALLLGLFAAYFLNNGISMLAYLGGVSCPTASLNCRRWSSVWPAASTCAAASTSMSAKTPGA